MSSMEELRSIEASAFGRGKIEGKQEMLTVALTKAMKLDRKYPRSSDAITELIEALRAEAANNP